MWWFYGWSGFWNMIYSACSCATFQDKRSWATHYPPRLNSTSLPFSSKKILETSECQYGRHFPSPVIRQTWPKNCRLNFPHPPWAKKRTAAKCQEDSEGLLLVPDPHEPGSSKQSPCDRAERSCLAKQQIWSVGWKAYIDNQSSQRKKTHKTQIRSLSLKGGKATKFKSGSFCPKQSRTNSERDRYTVKPELLIRERATCM